MFPHKQDGWVQQDCHQNTFLKFREKKWNKQNNEINKTKNST